MGFSRQEHWSGLPWPSPMHESEKWKWRCSVVSDSSWPHGLQPTRLLHPWDFPGKSAGVGCHCLVPFCLYMLNKTSQWNTWLSKVLKQKEELDKVVRHENCFLSAWLRKLCFLWKFKLTLWLWHEHTWQKLYQEDLLNVSVLHCSVLDFCYRDS